MKSILVISVLTILRLGIPSIVLLLIGEAVKHRFDSIRTS
jgi:hypothetical protein